MKLFAGSSGDIDRKNRLKNTVGGGADGVGGIYGESNMQTLITIHIIDSQ